MDSEKSFFPNLNNFEVRCFYRLADLFVFPSVYEGFGVPEDVLPPVRKFLEQVSAGSIENLLNRDGADSLYTKMNLTSVPVVMVWDRDGTLVQQFDDDYANKKLGRAFSYDDVRQVIEQVTQSTVKE